MALFPLEQIEIPLSWKSIIRLRHLIILHFTVHIKERSNSPQTVRWVKTERKTWVSFKCKSTDEALVKRWLECIIVWDDHFTVELKSGLKIEIEE